MTTTSNPSAPQCLIVVAAPVEAQAVCRAASVPWRTLRSWEPLALTPTVVLVMCGVGKVNAAACVARLLPGPYRLVLSAGIGGALPGSGLEIGQSVVATGCAYADEGIVTPQGFRDCAQMGFPLGAFGGRTVSVDSGLLNRLRPLSDRAGIIATVSTCSGTDAAAAEVVARTGGLVEGMEGAAVAHVAGALGVAAGELRVVSNTTGDRGGQQWDVPRATAALARVLGQALGVL